MLRDSAISYRPARFAQEDARAKKPIRQTSIRGRSACLRLNLLLQKYRQDATIFWEMSPPPLMWGRIQSVPRSRLDRGRLIGVLCICHIFLLQTKGTVLLVCGLCGLLEIRHATALTTGAKHWHQQKAVFYVFVSVPQYLSTEPKSWHIYKKETRTQRVSVRVWNI